MSQHEILRLDGKIVDIIPNTIDRTIQINDLGSAESRESSYSQTIKLPRTSNNQMIMGFLGVSGNQSRVPYKQVPVDYIVDGIPLIINGHAEVKATKQFYELVIYDGIIDLAEKLKNRTLSTLDYSDINHFLSVDTFFDSFENTEGYIYGLGLFGLGNNPNHVNQQVPSVYVHTLWNKIFSELGINYYGSFFQENEDFKSEVITPPQGYEVQDVAPTFTKLGDYSTDMAFVNVHSPDIILDANHIFNHNNTFNHSVLSFEPEGIIRINENTRLNISIEINYTSFEGHNNFLVYLNNRAVNSQQLINHQNTASIDLNISVKEGDTLYFMVRGTDTGYGDDENIHLDRYNVNYSASVTMVFSEASGGFVVDFNTIMGDMPQLDLIKDVMQRYGLVIKPVRGSDDYEFIQFESLLNDLENAEDWSQKVVGIEGEEYGVKYAKENTAEYDYHEDIEVPTHNGIMRVNNENAEAEKTLFKSPYTIPLTGRNGRLWQGNPLYVHELWEEGEEDGETVIKVKDSPIKVFRIKRDQVTSPFFFFSDSNTTQFNGSAPFLSLENMSMEYFLVNYYNSYQQTVDSYKEVDVNLYLNLLDIHDLDLFKLKYLKQTGKYYYVNEIKHNAGGKVSKAKLIELN